MPEVRNERDDIDRIVDLVGTYKKGMIVANELIYGIKEIVDQYPPELACVQYPPLMAR